MGLFGPGTEGGRGVNLPGVGEGRPVQMRGVKLEPIEVQIAAGAAQGPLEHLGLLGPEVGFQDGLHPGALGGR